MHYKREEVYCNVFHNLLSWDFEKEQSNFIYMYNQEKQKGKTQ